LTTRVSILCFDNEALIYESETRASSGGWKW
jgi:hypothetical protein